MVTEQEFRERAISALAEKHARAEEADREWYENLNGELKAALLRVLGIHAEPEDGAWKFAGLTFRVGGRDYGRALMAEPDSGAWSTNITTWADVGRALERAAADASRPNRAEPPEVYAWCNVDLLNYYASQGRRFEVVHSIAVEGECASLVHFTDVEVARPDVEHVKVVSNEELPF